MNRDNYGHYVNNAGVVIKVHTDKNGKDHISFYDGPVDGPHEALHVNIDYDTGTWNSHYHDKDYKSDDDDRDDSDNDNDDNDDDYHPFSLF